MWGLHAVMLVYLFSIFVRGLEGRIKKLPEIYGNFKPLLLLWNANFEKFENTMCAYNSSFIGNTLLKYYFKSWKNEFHRKYR